LKIYTFGLFILFSLSVVAQDYNATALQEAQSLYDEGKYLAAAEKYESILEESGKISFEVYYNLGNAYFKADKLPSAILNYERARKLQPTNEDLLFNLDIANQQVVDEFDQVPELGVSKWYKSFILSLSSNTWAYFSIVSFIITLAGLGAFLSGKAISIKKIAFIVSVITFFLSGITLLFASTNKSLLAENTEAVIFSPNVTATSAPAQQSISLFVLHEGTKVQVIEQQDKWVRIKISDGNIGWLPAEDITII
jgi:tetratricopeptide (TPR) repeat protein